MIEVKTRRRSPSTRSNLRCFQHFASFARSTESAQGATGFEAHMVYRGKSRRVSLSSHLVRMSLGYIDDVRNTDNAWVEAEIWNFHYGSAMSFANLRTDVSENHAVLS